MAKSVRKSMLTEGDGEVVEQKPAPETNEQKIAKMGGNIKGLYEQLAKSKEKIDQWKKERKAINDKIKAERESAEALGIPKMAFDAAMHYVDLDADKREGFDTGYIISREAFGQPVKGAQSDLFNEGNKG